MLGLCQPFWGFTPSHWSMAWAVHSMGTYSVLGHRLDALASYLMLGHRLWCFCIVLGAWAPQVFEAFSFAVIFLIFFSLWMSLDLKFHSSGFHGFPIIMAAFHWLWMNGWWIGQADSL